MTSDEAATEIASWPDALQEELDAGNGPLKRVTVLRETDSTQDAARRMHAVSGDVIVAARQVRGRGRLGSTWADTSDQGVAVTFVLPRESGERLAFVSAVATAVAAESLLGSAAEVGIKWPNDIHVDGKKLAGILIEQHDDLALVGIGMNVLQMDWPEELVERAVSLAQLRVVVTRRNAIRALLRVTNDVLRWHGEQVAEQYHARHVLRDRIARFTIGSETCTGRVVGLCIERGLHVETEAGLRWVSAATTRVVKEGLA